MREFRPFYSILFLFSLLVLSPWAQAQIWAPSGNAYSKCRAVYDSKTRQGYPQSAAQDEFNVCMSRESRSEEPANQAQETPDPNKSDVDSALGNYTQRSNSSSTKNKGTGSTNKGTPKKKAPAASNKEKEEDDAPSQAQSPKDICEANCQKSGYACYAANGERTHYDCRPANGSSSDNGSTGSDSSYVSQCTQEYETLYEACKTETLEAVGLCDDKNNSAMNQVSKVAQQTALMLGQATASNISAACSSAADLSAAANAAVAGFATYCNQGRDGCNEACVKASSFLRDKGESCFGTTASEGGRNFDIAYDKLMEQNKSCDALASKAQDAQQAIQNYAGTLQNSAQCAALTNGTTDLCKANPRLPGCSNVATECTTTACICSKNPMDPRCTGGAGNGDGIGVGGGGVDSSSRLAGKGNTHIDMTGDIPNYGIEPGKLNKDGTPAGIDGKQGGSAGIGGGDAGGGGGGGRGGGGGAPGDEKNVNAGFYGGGGGGGGFGSGGGSAAGGRGGYAGAGAANGKNGAPNLRSFLPGGKFDPRAMRGIAGATGPDGITGPHTDIWKKINNRYQVMSPSLMP